MLNRRLCLLTIVLTYYADRGSLKKCTSLKDIVALAKDDTGTDFNVTLQGCVERIAFDGKTLTQVYIREQTIPILEADSVRNMVKLDTVSFWGCKMDEVKPAAFRNVPRLKNVQFAYGNVKEIPRGLFDKIPELQHLNIQNNRIDVVEDQSFANLASLKRIHASNNQLDHWNREWFTNTTALEIMDFQNNRIRMLPRKAFASLRKLKQIYFDFNEISVIQEQAFRGITSLVYLGLRHNRLTSIPENIFPNELRVRSFLIDANHLNFLPNEVLKKLSVKDITIDNNPWKCPCLDRINYWLHTANATLRVARSCTGPQIPVCAYPSAFSQTCLEYVDAELTSFYIAALKKIKTLDPSCAKLD
ncbi:chondroadherin-like [Cylas formicarius]|uniref:chondroadherin-like n=1 Tax=Cylas formicarius TaxID=197179 RepID=UPI0029588B66|nr:chondroadherin-like [Cylas formicarius]